MYQVYGAFKCFLGQWLPLQCMLHVVYEQMQVLQVELLNVRLVSSCLGLLLSASQKAWVT